MKKVKFPYENLDLDDLANEEWEDIPGLDGYYCISNFGRVQRQAFELQCSDGSIRQIRPKIMKAELTLIKNKTVNDNIFFLRSGAMVSGKIFEISIARLVYYCFVKKFNLSDYRLVVLAKDGDGRNIIPANLILANLETKQQRIYERNRLKQNYYYTYDEFVREGVEKSVNPFCRQISQYTLQCRKIKTFPSIKAAAISLNITDSNILSVLKERQISSAGFVWRYGKEKNIDVDGLRQKRKLAFVEKRGQKVTQYNLQGKKIAGYLSLSEASRATAVSNGDISNVLSGNQRTAGGFIWRKGWGKETIDVKYFVHGIAWRAQKRQKKVNQFSLKGKLLKTFASVKDAAAAVGVVPSAITTAIKSQRPCRDFLWEIA